jgi:7-carboxy-7-deazaguanine synthase
MRDTLAISEIYGPVIQGEGAVIGTPTVFVRTGGCDYRCSWCDSLHAVLPEYAGTWEALTAAEVFARVQACTNAVPCLITLSGGNPALQPCAKVIGLAHQAGYTVGIETQGSLARPWFSALDELVVSPKPPSSGMPYRADRLQRVLASAGPHTRVSLKVVVFNETDYAFARMIGASFPSVPLFLQVGNPNPPQTDCTPDPLALLTALDALQQRVLTDRWYTVRVLPQLHTLLYGNQRGT